MVPNVSKQSRNPSLANYIPEVVIWLGNINASKEEILTNLLVLLILTDK